MCKKMKILLKIYILSLFCINCFAQADTAGFVKYDYSFKFKDGLYVDFSSFTNNSPIPFESVIKPVFDNSFFDALDTANIISYNGKYGNTVTVYVSELWGYSKNGKPYIFWDGKFNLIPFVGKITHFITRVKVIYRNYYDPFYSPYGYAPDASRTYQNEELKQYIINMENGKVLEYNLENVSLFLKQDEYVYNEFMKLRKRKRTKQMFYYINLYNSRNPYYIKK